MTDRQTQSELDAMPASREQQYADLFAAIDGAWLAGGNVDVDDYDNAEQALDDSILAVSQTRGFEVTISTGGPGEWLECVVEAEDEGTSELVTVTFVCAWWSAPQRTTVFKGSALWRLAERMNPWAY